MLITRICFRYLVEMEYLSAGPVAPTVTDAVHYHTVSPIKSNNVSSC